MLVIIEAVLTVLVIITAIVEVKKWKVFKIRHLIIGECIILIVCTMVGYLAFEMTRKGIDNDLYKIMSEVNNDLYNQTDETLYPENVYDRALITYLYQIDSKDIPYMYLSLEVINEQGDTFLSSQKNNVLFLYSYEASEEAVEQTGAEALYLEDYFTTEEINELRDYCANREFSYYTLSAIKGHYEDDHFILKEIDFESCDEYGNLTGEDYVVGKADETDEKIENIVEFNIGHNIYSYTRLGLITMNTNTATINRALKEIGRFPVDYNDSEQLYAKNTYGLVYSVSDNVWSSDGVNHGKYILNMYADTAIMTLIDSSFQSIIAGTILGFHAIGLLIITMLSVYIQKRELNQTRDLFINAMAHEMKTPVAVIENGTEMLKENLYPEKNEHYLDMMHEEAVHLNDLLGKMLTYTRTNKDYKLKLEEVNLSELVNNILKHYDIQKQLTVEIIPDVQIRCDQSLMNVVIDNFISNAVKYSDSMIKVQYINNTFMIFNDGVHLSEEDLKQIWDPLYKADSSRNDEHSTGMGLAISANILELHNFKYGVNQNEEGIEFYFTVKK